MTQLLAVPSHLLVRRHMLSSAATLAFISGAALQRVGTSKDLRRAIGLESVSVRKRELKPRLGALPPCENGGL